jgi:predicted transcriptional regulator
MSGRPAGKAAVSLRDFLTAVVKAANEGYGQSWVANELGVSSAAVSLRLKSLRDKGVKVPTLASARSANIADEATSILDELGIE